MLSTKGAVVAFCQCPREMASTRPATLVKGPRQDNWYFEQETLTQYAIGSFVPLEMCIIIEMKKNMYTLQHLVIRTYYVSE